MVDRAEPVLWAKIYRTNAYAMVVRSREVVLNPPSEA
jgi:hypothetical protein